MTGGARRIARGRCAWLVSLGLVGACGSDAVVAEPDAARPVEASPDRDADGLCDAAEEAARTDPGSPDTDGDGLPDGIEVGYGFDAANPDAPAADRLVYLEARRDAAIEFAVRVTVDGNGDDVTGAFVAEGALYDDGLAADAFFAQARAVSAMPPENVRAVLEETFVSVVGRARLEFSLGFEHPPSEPVDCTRAYPFRYDVKSSQGESVDDRLRLLVVASAAAAPEDWCIADACAGE